MLRRDERLIKHLHAKIARKDATIARLEAENDALGVRLHHKYTSETYIPKESLWRRLWRVAVRKYD